MVEREEGDPPEALGQPQLQLRHGTFSWAGVHGRHPDQTVGVSLCQAGKLVIPLAGIVEHAPGGEHHRLIDAVFIQKGQVFDGGLGLYLPEWPTTEVGASVYLQSLFSPTGTF